jgi:hypothetical protein
MPPRPKPLAPSDPWPVSGEDDRSPLDLAEQTNLAVIRERVRNGTSDFQDARWLLGIVDKLLG